MRAKLIAGALLLGAWAGAAEAQTAPAPVDRIAAAVAEAVQRFGMPESWIRAVMRRESGGDPRAVSPKGAMGLMQLMPDTWTSVRAQLGLGADPFDVHDNVLAGAAYLRQLYDQFGPTGFLAAYNAGPRRYLDFVTRGRPLPAETRAYVAAVTPLMGADTARLPSSLRRPVAPPPSVFVALDAAFARPSEDAADLFAVPAPK